MYYVIAPTHYYKPLLDNGFTAMMPMGRRVYRTYESARGVLDVAGGKISWPKIGGVREYGMVSASIFGVEATYEQVLWYGRDSGILRSDVKVVDPEHNPMHRTSSRQVPQAQLSSSSGTTVTIDWTAMRL